MVDSDHVEIRYSLWLMTPLWRQILNACKEGPPHRTQPIHSIIQRLIINNNQLFNTCQQEYYCVIDELKCHDLFSKYAPFSLTQVWIRTSHPQHSVAVTLSRVSGDRA